MTLAAPDLAFTSELSLFGVAIPVGVSVTPGASAGDLTLTPALSSSAATRWMPTPCAASSAESPTRSLGTRSLCIATVSPPP